MTQLAAVFAAKWQEFSWRRGAILAVVLGLLIIVGVLPHDRRYFLSAIFGALFLALADPAGSTGPGWRAWRRQGGLHMSASEFDQLISREGMGLH